MLRWKIKLTIFKDPGRKDPGRKDPGRKDPGRKDPEGYIGEMHIMHIILGSECIQMHVWCDFLLVALRLLK